MRIATICDPQAREPFPSFVHNTTTYVSIPHDHPSLLVAKNDEEPCWLSLQVEGRELHAQRLVDGQAIIDISKFKAPLPSPTSLTDTLSQILSFARGKSACRHTRLYTFSAVLLGDTADRAVLATYDFHVLCPREFEAACVFHRDVCRSPQAITPDTISDRTEGRNCPSCRQVRASRS